MSILLLQNYEPPILACALNEVLMSLAGVDFSTMPTLVVPFVVPESKLKLENRYLVTSEEYSVYGIKLGPTTDVTQDLSSTLQKPPPSMKINHENLACLLHLANVIKLPTLVLIGRSSQHLLHKTNKEELEVKPLFKSLIAYFSVHCNLNTYIVFCLRYGDIMMILQYESYVAVFVPQAVSWYGFKN